MARERGQTSSEYIALIVVVAAAILAVSFTDLGEAIRSQVVAAVEGIGGGGGAGGPGGPGAGGPGGGLPPGQSYGPGQGGPGQGGAPGPGGGHAEGPTATQSDPVNSLTGAFVTQATDATIPGPGLPW